jgi:DNA-binding GntR family transcriptional regulator
LDKHTRATAKQRAYDYLKSRIIDRTFEEGDFLTEAGIAQELGISRTPVREAFLLLEADSFVQLMPKKGAFIPQISLREMKEVMEVRALLETFAAEKVVERRSELIPKLRRGLEEQSQLLDETKIAEFVESDREFHRLIVSTADNNVLTNVFEALRDRQVVMVVRATIHSVERIGQIMQEHKAIVDTAEKGDVDGLKGAIREHLDNTLLSLMEGALA